MSGLLIIPVQVKPTGPILYTHRTVFVRVFVAMLIGMAEYNPIY